MRNRCRAGVTDSGQFDGSVAQREQAAARRQDRRGDREADKRNAMSERMQVMKSREDATMAMFKQMAQSRFGGQ